LTSDTNKKAPEGFRVQQGPAVPAALYTEAQRARRDASPWTLVQGLLAPVQFLVCLVSVALIARFLLTGEGLLAANISIIVKTLTLYTIMITGAIWEKEVFGQYLLAPAFFWEDVVSFAVLALHTAYLLAYFQSLLGPSALMALALAAYATYAVNAAQFLWKLRQARRQAAAHGDAGQAAATSATPVAGGAA
jgi:3-vinyl bacteriochlorophyllide hydratase